MSRPLTSYSSSSTSMMSPALIIGGVILVIVAVLGWLGSTTPAPTQVPYEKPSMRHANSAALLVVLMAAPAALAQTATPVQTQALAAPAPVGYGLATSTELGLSEQVWSGVNFKIWQALLTSQPQRQSSPVLRRTVAGLIAARAPLPALPPQPVDVPLIRAKALSGFTTTDTLGLFIASHPENQRSAALNDLRPKPVIARSVAEAQLQDDLLRETGKAPDLRAQKTAAAASGDVEAAEWLATYGYSDTTQLNAAYNAVTVPETESAKKLKGAMLRAHLWQTLQSAKTVETRARLLISFIDSAGTPAITGIRGALLLPLLDEIPSSAASAWAAPQLFALAAAQGNREAADAWYDTVASVRETLPQAETWQTRLWPVAMAMGLDAADPAALPQWVADTQSLPSENSLPVFSILTLLEARGLIVPRETWEQVEDTSGAGSTATGKVDTGQIDLLKTAAANGRQGEAILRASILADTDLSQVPVPVIAALIRAFAALGLNQLADDLTVEALLNLLYPAHG